MKVLIADDSPSSLRMIERVVTDCGHEAVTCTDGKTALELIEQPNSPQIVILDWMMPEASGLEITQHMTQTGQKEQRYVMILSAKDSKQEIALILNAGADDYLTKPMNRDEFVARLKVAERTITYQNEMRLKSEQLEQMLRRHHLLNAMSRTSTLVLDEQAGENATACYKRHDQQSPLVENALQIDAIAYFDRILAPAFQRMGLDTETLNSTEVSHNQNDYYALGWRPLYIPSLELWVDLLVDTSSETLKHIAGRVLEPKMLSGGQILDFWGEVIGLAESAFSNHLLHQDIETITPFFSQASNFSNLHECYALSSLHLEWLLRLEGEHLCRAHVFLHASPVNHRIFRNLRPMEILAADITPVDRRDTVLMKRWEVLSHNHLRYIERWASYQTIRDSIATITPSPLTQHLYNDVQQQLV